jgi:hypothetical protein
MAARFTKHLRQKIVREFAVRHNGQYDAALFLREVRETGKTHPAYEWFEWDADAAAQAYQLEQARAFARDLRVIFRVEEVVGPHSVRVRETPMPMVLSSLETRHKGGGYKLVDPDDPQHIAEHCRQAARTLVQWIERYQAAIAHAGVKMAAFEVAVGKLEKAAELALNP